MCLVDDDLSVRESLAGALQAMGFGVRTFESAEAFLCAPDVLRTDCLILDVTMPGMSGLELQELLIAEGRLVPIVFITARAEPAIETRAMGRGAIACLVKPFTEHSLLSAIEAALEPGKE